jgi:hypothetical protein
MPASLHQVWRPPLTLCKVCAGTAGPPPDFNDFATTHDDVFNDTVSSFGSWCVALPDSINAVCSFAEWPGLETQPSLVATLRRWQAFSSPFHRPVAPAPRIWMVLQKLCCRAGVSFNMNTTYPTAFFQFAVPVQRLTGVVTQLSTGMKLRWRTVIAFPAIHLCALADSLDCHC